MLGWCVSHSGMKPFYKVLAVALIAVTTNNFVWFALTYWAFLTTKSVVSTSTMGGIFLVITAISSIWLGSIVDHHKKKIAMLGSSVITLCLFTAGLLFYYANPTSAFESVLSLPLWIFISILLSGTIAGSIYSIAVPTLVTFIVPEDMRDRANGMFGTVIGISFGITSVASGIVLGYGGIGLVLTIAVVCTVLAILGLLIITIPEKDVVHTEEHHKKKVDLKGTIKAVRAIPGLMALIFFTTFNNFLGGVFFALMDAYGLSLVSVQVWGTLWGLVSFGFILGGLYISKKGVGKNPLFTLFRNNIITWTVCIFFAIQPSIVLLMVGSFVWMFFFPFIEAIEQSIFQKVVPQERLGRVFGFAHSVEQSASPITAFLIGPIAQLVFIPFMTTGAGTELIGNWFGVGPGRGLALVFIVAGMIGLAVTLLAMRSRSYKLLSQRYLV